MYCTKYLGTKYLKVVIKNEFGISGWLVIFFANGFPILLSGRLLMGLGAIHKPRSHFFQNIDPPPP